MRQIIVSKRVFATFDDEDYLLVAAYTWSAKPNKTTTYAITTYCDEEKSRRKYIFMHNLIMGSKGIDHIDGNGLNNQRSNLRLATAAQNNANARKQTRSTSSKYKGVYWQKKVSKWHVQITKDRKRIYLGLFLHEEDAAKAYDKAAKELFGEFAWLNFPPEEDRCPE